jgi:hypothetical protein
MKFTLIYDGPLPSCGKYQRVEEKQAIRRAINPQLHELCRTHPLVCGWLDQWQDGKGMSCFKVGSFDFVSLVSKKLHMVCDLDVLFLRRENPGSVVKSGGDIDNRVATLFDALRKPHRENELPANDKPAGAEEIPFLCLLEDDSLVTGISVRTERLLTPPGGEPSDVHLVIGVTVKVTELTYMTLGFGGD